MIKVLFFDFDGTISDAHSIAFKSMVQTLDELNYEFSRKKLLKLMGIKTHLIFKELGLDPGNVDLARRKFYKRFKKSALAGGIKLCVPVESLYELKKDYPLVVISNSRTSFIRASIKKLELKGLFEKVYGAEKFTSKDKLLKKLFKKMKIKPSEAAYIGDRFSDIEYARDAGCVAIAIHNKCAWSDLKTIKKEKPDYIIKNFKDLKKLVKKLNS